MNAKRVLLLAALLGAGFGGFEAVTSHLEAARIEHEVAVVRQRCAAAEAKLAETASQGSGGQKRACDETEQAETNRPATADRVAIGIGGAASRDGSGTAVPAAEEDEATALAVRYARVSDAINFRGMFRRLHLSPAQIAEFLDARGLMTEACEEMMNAARSQKTAITDPAMAGLADKQMQDAMARIRGVLGEEGVADCKRTMNATAALQAVESLASQLYYTEAPLSAAQGDLLSALIASHTAAPTPMKGILLSEGETDWTAVLAEAKGLLSSVQFAVLENSANATRLQKRQNDRVMALRVQPAQ